MSVSVNRAKRVAKSEWLSLALEILATEGLGGIRIERIARDLKVSKSGFYWHFKNREDLLNQMLDYWTYEYTTVIPQNAELQTMEPKLRLEKIMTIVRDFHLAKYDLAVRAWAETDELAKKALKKVYKARLEVIGNAFKELGFKGEELEMRTRTFVCYHSWESSMLWSDSKRKSNRLIKIRHRMLTKK